MTQSETSSVVTQLFTIAITTFWHCIYYNNYSTPFAVHYEKVRNHLRGTATKSAKIHSLARKYEHLRVNQIQ